MPSALTIDEVVEVLEAVRELPELLTEADMELRADVYRSLGLQLAYRREGDAEYVRVLAAITGVDLVRVGGARGPRATRVLRAELEYLNT